MYSFFVFYLPQDDNVFGLNMKVIVYVNQFEYTYVLYVHVTMHHDKFSYNNTK